ncbi:MAG TPA: HAD family hydrolase [Burkholderiales bacterium]|nr:HAD family hydrolase [Burkholderiales bacterium]
MNRPAVFIDKDGTLIEDVPYNVDPARIRLAPDAGPALRRLHERGFRIAVISNQSGVAMGRFEETALVGVERRLRQMLAEFGVPLLAMYWCPHHPDGSVARYAVECDCRKPQAGLLLRAADAHRVDLGASWMVGDILDDIEAGRRAGCRTILIDNGHETQWRTSPLRSPHVVASSLMRAAEAVCDALLQPAPCPAEP